MARCTVGIDPGDPALPVVGRGALGVVRPSRRARWRAAVLALVHVAIAAHVTHWLVARRTLSPVEPSESMYTLELGQVNAGFLFFVVALAATLVFGRFVCGWGCHLVALQDLCAWLMKRLGIRPRPFRSRALAWAPALVALYMFAWPTLRRLFIVPAAFPGFSDHLVTDRFWQTFPGPWMAALTLLVCGFVAVWFLGSKGFCTYGCPYGALFSAVDRLSPARILVSDACDQCGHCTATCTSNVRVHDEVRLHGRVVDPGCMKCMDCVDVCPKGALRLGWGRPALFERAAWRRAGGALLGIREEAFVALVAVVATLSFRGLYEGPYGGPGLLLAVALGGITAAVALSSWRLVSRPAVRLQNMTLRLDGRIRPAGVVFAALAAVWLGFAAHSAFVQWHRARGAVWLARTEATRSEVFDGSFRGREYPAAHREALARARKNLSRAERFGFLPMLDVETGLAWALLLDGEIDGALGHLDTAIRIDPENDGLRRDRIRLLLLAGRPDDALRATEPGVGPGEPAAEDHFLRAGLLVERGRLADAVEAYRACIALAPDSAEARFNLGGLLRRLDRPAEAVVELERALALAPGDRETEVELGLALAAAGDPLAAAAHLRQAIALAPDHPESLYHLPGLVGELEAGGAGAPGREPQ